MAVDIHLPEALAGYNGGRRDVSLAVGSAAGTADDPVDDPVDDPATGTVAGLFDLLAAELPALERRIRDERGEIRRHVNVYVDGEDIRSLSGVATPVPDGASVSVVAAISGG